MAKVRRGGPEGGRGLAIRGLAVVATVVGGIVIGIVLGRGLGADRPEDAGGSSPRHPSPTDATPPGGGGESAGPLFPDVFGRVTTSSWGRDYQLEVAGDEKLIGPITLILDDGSELFVPPKTPVNAICRDLALVAPDEYGPCLIQATLMNDGRTVARLYVFVEWRDETGRRGFVAITGDIAAVVPGFIVLPDRTAIPLRENPVIACEGIDEPRQLPDHPAAGFRLFVDRRTGRIIDIECTYFL